MKNEKTGDVLADKLQNDIVFGVYAMGTRLMEDRVMQRYDVTRHAVRNAFNDLKARGLLVHVPNRGVEVVSFTADEVDSIYEIRTILETAAAERTNLPVSGETIKELENIAKAHEQACLDGNYGEVFDLNYEFHRLQFSCCKNERLMDLIQEHARIVAPIRVVKYDDAKHMEQVVQEHFEIIKAMNGTSQQRYVDATRKHLPASAKAFRATYENRSAGVNRQITG